MTVAYIGVLSGVIGLILSLVGNFYCGFSSRKVVATSVDNPNLSTEFTFNAGIWSYEDYAVWYSVGDGVLYYKVRSFCVPWNSRDDIVVDGRWMTARIFTVLASVLAGTVVIGTTCLFANDGSVDEAKFVFVAMCLITLCQGLIFLYFPSNGCKDGSHISDQGDAKYLIEWDNCELSSGAVCAIVSTCFFFLSSMLFMISMKRPLLCLTRSESDSSLERT
jgi:hypothetical protein